MIHCQCLSIDLRGHGDTQTDDDDDLSADTLATYKRILLHKNSKFLIYYCFFFHLQRHWRLNVENLSS